MLNRCLKA